MGIRQRLAAARREYEGVTLPDVPLTRERFRVDIEQNHSTAGLGTTALLKWRFSVVDTANGDRAQRSDYAFTRAQAEMEGNRTISKILDGSRPLR